MFGSAANPYDEVVIKATDENLASEDWALNMDVCDRVSGDGQTGARNAVAALQKRLAHRNPSVQLYSLELANTLVQNCGKTLHTELSSRNFTTALDRLVNDRATAAPVQKKALTYIKSWAKEFEESRDPNLGMMSELYDQLRAKNFNFDGQEAAPVEDREAAQRRREEEELQRVLELSKQDKGGRGTGSSYQPSGSGSGAGSSAQPAAASAAPLVNSYNHTPAPQAAEPERPLDINTATRVRALYNFTSADIGELDFERGDVIKVLDRGFREWWRGACNGKIGIFPVTYVEAMPEPSVQEIQEEAQEEARVFASLGLVEQLLQTLKTIDTTRGQRLDDRPEIEEMYQSCVGLQGPINALIKKYSDQKAELEHMNAAFTRAMQQYEELRAPMLAPGPQPHHGYAPQPAHDPYAGQAQYAHHQQSQPHQQPYPQQPHPGQQYQPEPAVQFPQVQSAPGQPAPQQPYYQHNAASSVSVNRVASGGPGYPPQEPQRQDTEPGAAGIGSGAPHEHQAAWDAYYRQQGQVPPSAAPQGQPQAYPQGQPPQLHHQGSAGSGQGYPQAQPYGQSPYPATTSGGQQQYAGGVDGVAGSMTNMSLRQ